MKLKLTFKLLAPYFAVGVFWCVFSNAWLAIVAYHVQILFWRRKSLSGMRWPTPDRILLLVLPAAVAGPLLYFLLPYMIHTDPATWLADHRLSRVSLLMMVPYFGLLHPCLEQLHWTKLRESTPVAHPMFAGYHLMVLHSLLTPPWLVVCFIVLTTVSIMWQQLSRKTQGLDAALVSHVLADLGIIIAAWLKA